MSDAVKEKNDQIEELRAKGEMYDNLLARADQLERDNQSLSKQNMLHSVTMKVFFNFFYLLIC